MKRVSKWNGLLVAALLIGVAALLAVGPASGQDGAQNSLNRNEDPVVVPADKFKCMENADVEKMAVLAWKGGAFAAIPFQVDERAPDGMFVYKDGPKADPKKGNNEYDHKDELVFMAWDAGDQAPDGAAMPCDADKKGELTLTDPVKGGQAWVYVVECDAVPPRSTVDYVRNEYDGTRDWIKTDRYHFAEKRGSTFFDRLALKNSSGKVGPNLCDRIKGRTKVGLARGMIELTPGEESLSGSIEAWIDGPVRTIHRMQGYYELSAIKIGIGGVSENLFYANYFVTPIKIDLPFNPESVLTSFAMRYAIDWLPNFEGTKYYDPINTKGVTIDGKMDADEKAMDKETGHDWYALAGDQGNMVVRMVLPGEWRKSVPLKTYYVDDVNAPDPPESDPGQRCAGFLMDQMIKIPAGSYTYSLFYMVPDQAPPASVPQMLNILDKPVAVSGRELD